MLLLRHQIWSLCICISGQSRLKFTFWWIIFQFLRTLQPSVRVAADQDRLQGPLQPEMHGRRLSDMAPAKQGNSDIKYYWFIVSFRRCMFVCCHCKQSTLGLMHKYGLFFLAEFLSVMQKKTWSTSSLFDRESCAWWARSRSLWSAGQATVACWSRAIPGSFPQSRASAQHMILNGNHFPRLSFPNGDKSLTQIFMLQSLQLHVYKTAPSNLIVLH